MTDQEYGKKVIPFLKDDYFQVDEDKILFTEVKDFIINFNQIPNKETLLIEIDKHKKLKDTQIELVTSLLSELETIKSINDNTEWLLRDTEKFCQDKAIYNAMVESIAIMNGEKKGLEKGSIPKLLQDSLAITFDPHVGHDYLEDSDERFEFYHRPEEKIPFDLQSLNKMTKNGVARKTLNIIMGGINVGKTLVLCHFAASYLSQGKNVLYITLEMAQERIAERIDANLLNVTLDTLKSKTTGRLVIKEFPTASASALNFRALLNELYLKKTFRPDIIIIDYINICASSRMKPGSVGSYFFIKSVAEELRGLAVEFNVPIWSATQLTRGGFKSSDVDLDDVAESFGLPATADFMAVIMSDEGMEELNQYMLKQLKNRYNSKSKNRRFVIGVDYDRMRLLDVAEDQQEVIEEDSVSSTETSGLSKKSLDKFKGLKV